MRFATLREAQASFANSGQEEFADRLQRFVAGLTYQTAVCRTSIAYLGPEFSYSYSAAAKFFGAIDTLVPVNTIGMSSKKSRVRIQLTALCLSKTRPMDALSTH